MSDEGKSRDQLLKEVHELKGRIKELEANSFKQHTELEIFENTVLFHELVNSIPDLIFCKDRQGKYIVCNPAFSKFLGRPKEEIIGKTDHDLFGNELANHFLTNDKKIIEENNFLKIEELAVDFNGKEVLFETFKAPLYTSSGTLIGILGVSRDITPRKRIDEELAKTQEQLISVLEAFDQPAYVCDPVNYDILFVNSPMKKRYGNEILGKKCYSVFQNLDSPCSFCTNHLIFGENIGQTHIWEFQNNVDDRWYRCIDKAINWPDGRMVRFEIAIDIHEQKIAEKVLKESEKKYRAYIDNSPQLIFVADAAGRYIEVNPAACIITGYSKNELLNMHRLDLYAPESKEAAINSFKQLLSTGRSTGEFCFIKKNGTKYYMVVEAVKLSDDRVVGFCIDSTERKRTEEDLLKAKIVAENSNRTKSEFLATMSHELRTPLNSIIGFSEVLSEGYFGQINEKQAKYLKNISNSGKHLLNIINNILDISKVESGKMQLYKEKIYVKELVDEMVSAMQHLAASKEIVLKIRADSQFGAVQADKAKLRQILYNLIGNAIKFTDISGSVTIGSREDDEMAYISVTDTGIGIPANDLTKLFKPFTQLDSSCARKYEGTGLGLALAKELAELHGGTINVESEPGKGSTFTLALPLKENRTTLYSETDESIKTQHDPCCLWPEL
ncbi:PAS domain-containing sensor histidine kinase [uncultured Methanomethylovorans sp.]|uniref:PAS domain-containing sensor histidine kinase n=1 Tax=uncultured Methanomethylovorans sp. TaxID=183759 RepID=UPI002603F3AE|nr:PAS domain S-box protein [uncultured Methanomethylovorans sp.]